MSKVTSTSFKKGVSGNPKGKPKGTLNKDNMLRVEFMKKALDDLPNAYEELRQSMKEGEGWAHTLFFKTLIPQRTFEQVVNINLSEDRLQATLKGLKEFQELTHDEILAEIKTLSSVKLAEKSEGSINMTDKEQRAILTCVKFLRDNGSEYNEFIEYKKNKGTLSTPYGVRVKMD